MNTNYGILRCVYTRCVSILLLITLTTSPHLSFAYKDVTIDNWYSLPGDPSFPTVQQIEALRRAVHGNVYDARDPEEYSAPTPYIVGNYGQVW